MMYVCVKSLLQDNFNTAKMIKTRPQTVVVLPLEHAPPPPTKAKKKISPDPASRPTLTFSPRP